MMESHRQGVGLAQISVVGLMAQIITRLIRPSSMHSLARQSRAICSILFQF